MPINNEEDLMRALRQGRDLLFDRHNLSGTFRPLRAMGPKDEKQIHDIDTWNIEGGRGCWVEKMESGEEWLLFIEDSFLGRGSHLNVWMYYCDGDGNLAGKKVVPSQRIEEA